MKKTILAIALTAGILSFATTSVVQAAESKPTAADSNQCDGSGCPRGDKPAPSPSPSPAK